MTDSRISRLSHGNLEQRLRLWSGLVLAVYVIPHTLNHTLGLISIEAMDSLRWITSSLAGTVLGGIVLYGAFLLHFGLALAALYRRAHLRMPAWEAAQLILGLLIWPLLIGHAVGTRTGEDILGAQMTYELVVANYWLDENRLWAVTKQSLLVLVVWGHLVFGLHFWLRLKPWYQRLIPVLYPLAVLIPILSVLGFLRAGLSVLDAAAEPGWAERVFNAARTTPPEARALVGQIEVGLLVLFYGAVAAVLAARVVRRLYRNRHGTFRMRMPGGQTVTAPRGQTILEAVRAAGLSHASVCGGRGRCTTCRVRVGTGGDDLPPPNEIEARALTRISAPPNVRLACQVRPQKDVVIVPLLPPTASVRDANRRGGVDGAEQNVVVLFADLRGSTRLGEQKFPYDVLFVLNQFFEELSAALQETNGHYAQFQGDGVMALYGLETGLRTGVRQALEGATQMLSRLDDLNRRLEGELNAPLRMGIGIHAGEAIVGTMGPPTSPNFSAIGDNVNIAARLESQTKPLDCALVVSADAVENGGLDFSSVPRHEVTVPGRTQPIAVYAVSDPATIRLPDAG